MDDFTEDASPFDSSEQVSLAEASQAAMDVLEEAHAELAAIRHRLREGEMPKQLKIDEEELPSPRDQARHVAARLEACVGTLRGAIDNES
ncbi:MAG: hypothetical protein ABEK75_12065 [Salinibacter sp.]